MRIGMEVVYLLRAPRDLWHRLYRRTRYIYCSWKTWLTRLSRHHELTWMYWHSDCWHHPKPSWPVHATTSKGTHTQAYLSPPIQWLTCLDWAINTGSSVEPSIQRIVDGSYGIKVLIPCIRGNKTLESTDIIESNCTREHRCYLLNKHPPPNSRVDWAVPTSIKSPEGWKCKQLMPTTSVMTLYERFTDGLE